MKRFLILALAAVLSVANGFAQEQVADPDSIQNTGQQVNENNQLVKTGLNFGPLPAVAYDADAGIMLGALLNIYNFGNGERYPNYNSKWFFEGAYYTKGSQLYIITYDNLTLIPGVRFTAAASYQRDKAMDFFGFNGYESPYNYEAIEMGKSGESFIYTPFYKFHRDYFLFKTDFVGNITKNFKWQAGYQLTYFGIDAIDRENINKGKKEEEKYPDWMSTLYEDYVKIGNIKTEEAKGGLASSIRAGFQYDSRDKEGAPTRGIWADAHVILAPKFLGSKNEFYRYSLTWRHYIPIVKNDKLTFAYRINYEGNFGNSAPFYVLPFISVMGENFDKDGMGGYRTVRGMMRDRVVGLDMLSYVAELRWRFVAFRIGRQNIALGLNAFSDGSMVTRKIETVAVNNINTVLKERMHSTVGLGFRFIMNENFIVAAEYGKPITSFMKNSPYYKQDGNGAFYINTGFLF